MRKYREREVEGNIIIRDGAERGYVEKNQGGERLPKRTHRAAPTLDGQIGKKGANIYADSEEECVWV